jgi:hypothetical protein
MVLMGCEVDYDEALEWLSLAWENVTGYDSIPTIERVYNRSSSGAYVCIWPGCRFTRHDPEVLWRHVHSAHGYNTLPPSGWPPPELDTGL